MATNRRWSKRVVWSVFLIAAILNVPLTLQLFVPRKWTHKPTRAFGGVQAAERRWPAPTPHEIPWPNPTDYAIEEHFGRSMHTASCLVPGQGMGARARITHKMIDERYGWPLPSIRRVKRWWPDNQEWRLDAEWDTGARLAPVGALLNPVIFGGAAWVVIFVPQILWTAVAARRRRRRKLCAVCGYPIGVSPVCTECGAAVSV